MDYLDGVLLKLKRAYSKDETVAALTKKLSEVEFELGVVTSERDEYLHELKPLRVMRKNYDNVVKGSKNCRDKNRELKAEVRFLTKENIDLRNKLF